ncbi:MAG: SDR family oxidoreductase [Actinobacteria bacterium]|nr:SDR family oxidoreductase [Actinomycetota bacterium]
MSPESRPLLILGAGYIGAKLAEVALDAGHDVILADNWHATKREQLSGLQARGARVETADIRRPPHLERLLEGRPAKVFLLAAQASRPLADRDPDYTEETNVTGARHVAEAVAEAGVPLVYASSAHVYGDGLEGEIGPDRPYGMQRDLAHLSKVYAEMCLQLYATRAAFDLSLLRLGIVYGPSPVEHARPESQTVVDKFKRLAAAGEELPLDDGGRATIGVVHVEDAARILLESPSRPGIAAENVVAETTTVAGVAALARGEEPSVSPAWTFASPFEYRHRLAEYL